MQQTAESELGRTAEDLLEKLATFEIRYPERFQSIDEMIFCQNDLNLGDLVNLLQMFSEIVE